MKKVTVCLIRLYQRYISPLKSRPSCRFVPTCSEYAIEAIEKRGFFIGTLLAIWRILRCNPFCKGGIDPVPEKKSKRSDKPDTPNDDKSSQGDM
ncbi:MAG: membrane protein insertion efficiency factor YidD [Clostridiales bacterium]|nr:membrane protein insertion efficiency factor YidD [Clostridiales bacterium]